MSNMRSRVLRYALVLGSLATAAALSPAAMARVSVGFNVHIGLPPGVHVSVGNYEPYYVGRIFYEPVGVWRPVYSFPTATPYGVAYHPYIYDGGRVVCQDYIPGAELGYGQLVIEGRGHYNPSWHHPGHAAYGHAAAGRAYYGRDHGWNDHGYGHGDWHGGGDRGSLDRSRGDRGDSRGNGHGHGHGHSHKHDR